MQHRCGGAVRRNKRGMRALLALVLSLMFAVHGGAAQADVVDDPSSAVLSETSSNPGGAPPDSDGAPSPLPDSSDDPSSAESSADPSPSPTPMLEPTPPPSDSAAATPTPMAESPSASPAATSAGTAPDLVQPPADEATVDESSADVAPMAAAAVAAQPVCAAGYVYGIRDDGQIRQVAPNGTVTDFGSPARTRGDFNGLGIGSGGGPVFAYDRAGTGNSVSNVSIYRLDPATGAWADTNHNVDGGTYGVTFVAGAVNLDTGTYFLGGFSGSGTDRVFRLWEYNPATNTSVYKGRVATPGDGETNGDIAFDAAGNLFIVRGSGSTTTIHSVTAANLSAANGGLIPAATSRTVSDTTSNVNGVAFDADGRGFLSGLSTVERYSMPGWTSKTSVTSNLGRSNDLASCSSPPTITIEKVVEGGRVNSADQFTMTLTQGTTVIGTATTTGTATGVQDQRVGPLPTVRNVLLTLTETASGTTNMNQYATSWRCLVDGVQTSQGNGRVGTVTIPTGGNAVLCSFYNSPLTADVTVTKLVTDALGQNPTPTSGWTVGASTIATTGTATSTPTAATQSTNATGQATWRVTFGGVGHRATVSVSETQQAGYGFVSGECTVTHLDGTTTPVTLTGPSVSALTDIGPGDDVACTYVNRPLPGTLEVVKAYDDTVPADTEATFSGTYSCTLSGTAVASGTWTRTGIGAATLTADAGSPAPDTIPAGAECTVAENPPSGSTGLPNASYVWGAPTVGGAVAITSGQTSTVTVTNTVVRVYGDLQVTKVLEGTADPSAQYSGEWSCALDDETVTGAWGPIAAGGTWNSTADDGIPFGATCVVISETRPDWPVAADHSYQWDGPADLGGTAVAAADGARVTVTNTVTRVLGAVSWTKVDGDGVALVGSAWELTGPEGETVAVGDCVAADASSCTGPDLDPAAGAFLVTDLAWGDYTLIETTAPAGYILDDTPYTFTIGEGTAGTTIELGSIENVLVTPPTIPLTGGLGRDFFALAAIGLLALGAGALAARRWMRRDA